MQVLVNQGITGLQGIGVAEAVLATVSIPANPGKVRIRGQLPVVNGSGGAGTTTLRIRQVGLTGNQLWSGPMSLIASGLGVIPFEIEDDTSFSQGTIPPGIAVWVLTGQSTVAAGVTGSSGNICVESMP